MLVHTQTHSIQRMQEHCEHWRSNSSPSSIILSSVGQPLARRLPRRHGHACSTTTGHMAMRMVHKHHRCCNTSRVGDDADREQVQAVNHTIHGFLEGLRSEKGTAFFCCMRYRDNACSKRTPCLSPIGGPPKSHVSCGLQLEPVHDQHRLLPCWCCSSGDVCEPSSSPCALLSCCRHVHGGGANALPAAGPRCSR